jgi:hypothetical protein
MLVSVTSDFFRRVCQFRHTALFGAHPARYAKAPLAHKFLSWVLQCLQEVRMSHTVRAALISGLLASFILSASVANAQEKEIAPKAPVPSQILTSKNGFISNGGLDGIAFEAFHDLGDVNQPYNAFYHAVSSWGRYTVVSAPAEADLVFEIRFTAPFNGEHVHSCRARAHSKAAASGIGSSPSNV